jgi:hypothetical protein
MSKGSKVVMEAPRRWHSALRISALGFRIFRISRLHSAGHIPLISPRQRLKPQIKCAIEFIKRNPHIKPRSRRRQPFPPGCRQKRMILTRVAHKKLVRKKASSYH